MLAELAKLRAAEGTPSPLADALFEEAYSKLTSSLRLHADDSKALNYWGNTLCDHASTMIPYDCVRANELLTLADNKYRDAAKLQPNDRSILYNWGNQLRRHARVKETMGHPLEACELLQHAIINYRRCIKLPSLPGKSLHKDTLTIDAQINWGCALLALARLYCAQGDLDAATQQLSQARDQFSNAASVIKLSGLPTTTTTSGATHPESPHVYSYATVLAYNFACIAALLRRCSEPQQESLLLCPARQAEI